MHRCVYFHDIMMNTWHKAPSLVETRIKHSSCVLGSYIYTFCGQYEKSAYRNSIERIDADKVVHNSFDQIMSWEVLELPGDLSEKFIARELPIVAQISSTSLVILGGFNIKNYMVCSEGESYLNGFLDDIWTLKVQNEDTPIFE